MVKIAGPDDAFLEVFLTASKPSRRSIRFTAAKRKEKEKKGKAKKKMRIEKLKDVKINHRINEVTVLTG